MKQGEILITTILMGCSLTAVLAVALGIKINLDKDAKDKTQQGR